MPSGLSLNATPKSPARLGRLGGLADPGEIAFVDLGPDDRPVDVVFCHANGVNGGAYRSVLAPAARTLRIWALDLRGHGSTTLPADPDRRVGWTEFSDDLAAFLRAHIERPVILSGHSMGGTVSLMAAAEAPEKVRRLVLFDPAIMPRLWDGHTERRDDAPLVLGALKRRASFPDKAAAVDALVGRGIFRTWSRQQIADYVEGGLRPVADGGLTLACRPEWEASNYRIHNCDPWDALARVRAPIVIRRAETGSPCATVEHEPEFDPAWPIEIETIAGTTHFLPMERPDVVAEALTRP
ncbi:MAG: alpha/beta hydrolase [Caulobacteraceae bacterium]|nr:alpha/beta hydrolase [Caulobacteraceae bacterium]